MVRVQADKLTLAWWFRRLDPSHSSGIAAEDNTTASDNERSVHYMAEAPYPTESVDAHGCPIKEAEAPSPPLFQNGVLTFQGMYGERMCVTIISQLLVIL